MKGVYYTCPRAAPMITTPPNALHVHVIPPTLPTPPNAGTTDRSPVPYSAWVDVPCVHLYVVCGGVN